jgi:hypothetical protein
MLHLSPQNFPMLTWVDYQDEYLDEMLWGEGRGYSNVYSTCLGCGQADPTFRCVLQTCLGVGLCCKHCIIVRHAVLPRHWVQVRTEIA